MDPIYKVTSRESDGKPVLQQMELGGRSTGLYDLRYTQVWAVNLRTARAIQRDYRQSNAE